MEIPKNIAAKHFTNFIQSLHFNNSKILFHKKHKIIIVIAITILHTLNLLYNLHIKIIVLTIDIL